MWSKTLKLSVEIGTRTRLRGCKGMPVPAHAGGGYDGGGCRARSARTRVQVGECSFEFNSALRFAMLVKFAHKQSV